MNTETITLSLQEVITETFVREALEAEIYNELQTIVFSKVWHFLGYSRIDNAVRALKNKLEQGIDWIVFLTKAENSEGRPREDYRLSVDGFKMLCMMAETEEGRATRLHFIRAEEKYRESLENLLNIDCIEPRSKLYQDLADAYSKIHHLETDLKALSATRNDITGISQRKIFLPNRDDFNIAIVTACDVIGYASVGYLMKILKDEFVQELDWTINRLGEVFVTEACLHELVIVARPQRGAKINHLPKILIVERDRMFKSVDPLKANTRFGSIA